MKVSSALRAQQGQSLISMMVGLLLSMLCVMTCFTAYKNLVHVSAENRVFDGLDGRLAIAMAIIEKSVQSAGYGMLDADNTDLVTTAVDTTRQLLWRYIDDAGVVQCEGAEEITTVTGGTNYREIRLVNAPVDCTADVDLTTLAWVSTNVLARWEMNDNEVTDYITNNGGLLSFAINQQQCTPFGAEVTTPVNHFVVNITSVSSVHILNNAVPQVTYGFCLSNFYPS